MRPKLGPENNNNNVSPILFKSTTSEESLEEGGDTTALTMKMHFNTNKHLRHFLAEFLGTFCLVLIGDGAVAQFALSANPTSASNKGGNFIHVAFGYGLALMVGICVSGGVSGGHLNPAVTLAMAVMKKLRWAQLPVYWAGQYLGAFMASLVLWGNYADAIAAASPGDDNTIQATAGIFASYPSYPTEQVALYTLAADQILGTFLLLIIIFAVTDEHNMNISGSLVPLTIGLGLTVIHLSFGLNAGSAINPARDFSPRLFTLIAGWEDSFSAADHWFWIPLLLPHIGAVLAAGSYAIMISAHHPEE